MAGGTQNSTDPNHRSVRVEDVPSADLATHFEAVTEYIEGARLAGRPVLVHCVAGVSRSVSVILAYLVRYQKMTLDDAFKHVKAQRPCALPNIGFWDQLFEWEVRFLNKVSVDQRRFIRQRGARPFFRRAIGFGFHSHGAAEFVRQVSLNGDALFSRRLSDNGCAPTGGTSLAAAAAAARDSSAAACAPSSESSGSDEVSMPTKMIATGSLE